MTARKLLLELLRGGLHADYVPQIEAVDERTWQMAYRLAESNTVTGLTFWGVSKLPNELRPPVGIRTRWLARTAQIGKTNEHLDETAVKLFKAFEEAGVEAVVMKGQAVARYYPKPELRQPGDIDLYADAENYRGMCDVVSKMSSTGAKAERHLTVTLFGRKYNNLHHIHVSYVVDGVVVECHRRMLASISRHQDEEFGKLLGEWYRTESRRIDIGIGSLETLPVWFDCVYVLAHLFMHFLHTGIGLRHVSDWLMVARAYRTAEDFDEERLMKALERLGLLTMARLLCGIGVHALGYGEQELPLEPLEDARMEREVLEDVITGGNWGREHTHPPRGRLRGGWHRFRYYCKRCKHFKSLSPRELAHPVRHKLVDKFVKPFVFRRAEY